MRFENTVVLGLDNALYGMRLPMCDDLQVAMQKSDKEKDITLLQSLVNADDKHGHGCPNSKAMRMIHVQVCITAPQYWWSEFDTYKIGTVANSTSKMHRLMKKPITLDCFARDTPLLRAIIGDLELLRQQGKFEELMNVLPQSYMQSRMCDFNYAVLRNMIFWRKNHKLNEWKEFCAWGSSLPLAEQLLMC